MTLQVPQPPVDHLQPIIQGPQTDLPGITLADLMATTCANVFQTTASMTTTASTSASFDQTLPPYNPPRTIPKTSPANIDVFSDLLGEENLATKQETFLSTLDLQDVLQAPLPPITTETGFPTYTTPVASPGSDACYSPATPVQSPLQGMKQSFIYF